MAMHATVAPVTEPDAPRRTARLGVPTAPCSPVPGRERDVTFFERGTWTELEDHRLMAPDDAGEGPEAGHAGDVAFVAGLQTASTCSPPVGRARRGGRRLLAKKWWGRITHDTVVCGAAWRAEGNALALVDANGQWAVWKNPVPGSMKSPTEAATAEELDFFTTGKVAGAAGADEDDAEMEEDDEDGLGDMDEEEYYGEMERRKRMKRKAAAAAKNAPALKWPGPSPPAAAVPGGLRPRLRRQERRRRRLGRPRRFLCRQHDGHRHHHRRGWQRFQQRRDGVPDPPLVASRPSPITTGTTSASSGERGCALASPGKSEGGAATVFYRPYESWAHTSEWRVTLPAGESRHVSSPPAGRVAALTSVCSARLSPRGAQHRWCSPRAPP